MVGRGISADRIVTRNHGAAIADRTIMQMGIGDPGFRINIVGMAR
ncbi:hypothetical protein P6144_16065 [Sphingomonas sp. HITSZ_GF]|nr:hypothetical protein [Sphingomonas sp. HITSZ_GF]MDG2535176.1 hypothetical protein [Sphingomonas sp. HITSZ_GF]